MAHFGMVWHVLEWFGIFWHGLAYFDMVWHVLEWFGIFWHGLAYFDMVSHYQWVWFGITKMCQIIPKYINMNCPSSGTFKKVYHVGVNMHYFGDLQ